MHLQQLVVILKLTKACNLNCAYCYEGTHHSAFLPEPLLFKCMDEALALTDHVTFTLHGGEPLLAGKRFFCNLLQRRPANISERHSVTYHLQTNGTLIDQEWADMFARYQVHVGISLDGPEFINDRNRIWSNGRGTFRTVYDHTALLQARGVEPGCLAVITRESRKHVREIFEFFQSGPFKFIDLLPCTARQGHCGCSEPGEMLSPGDYAAFMTAFFDLWMASSRSFQVRTFADMIRTRAGSEAQTCSFIYPKSCVCQIIAVDVNADIYPCDRLLGFEGTRIGNIADQSLAEIISGQRARHFIAVANSLPQQCCDCNVITQCYGGCVYHRFIGTPGPPQVSYFCHSYKSILRHIEKRLPAGESLCI